MKCRIVRHGHRQRSALLERLDCDSLVRLTGALDQLRHLASERGRDLLLQVDPRVTGDIDHDLADRPPDEHTHDDSPG
jgi:hypothetical protein